MNDEEKKKRRDAYVREFQKEWRKKRRLDWITENGPCRECGSWERLEVDHIDPSAKLHHNIWSWSESRRLAELSKCQVLCHRCHRLKTNAYLRELFKTRRRKLSDEERKTIASQLLAGASILSLSKKYDIHETVIRRIRNSIGISRRIFGPNNVRSGNAKLQPEQVRAIRKMIADGLNNCQIARLFDVERTAVSAIRTGKSWSWLDREGGA